MKTWKQYLPDVLAVVLFALISFAYFFPADIEGKILYRHDAAAGKGLGREIAEHRNATGEVTRWMNSTFSGMPTYQTAPEYTSTKGLTQVMKAYHLFLPENVWYVFAYLLGFYILLRAFDFQAVACRFGLRDMGFLQLFLYHHSRRTHMEGHGFGISAADDCRCGAGFRGQISVGIHNNCSVYGV